MYHPNEEPAPSDREQVSAYLHDTYGDFYARLRSIEDAGQEISMFYRVNKVVNEASRTTTVPAFDAIDPLMVRDRMEDLRQLIESVGPTEDLPKPGMSILIPLAVANEDPSVVSTVLTQIQKSQRDLGEPVEAIVWANARKSDSAKAGDNYQEIRQRAAEFATSDLQISTAFQLMPEKVVSMSRVRSSYMEAFMALAREKGYDIDHPTMWVDADTTFMTKNCLRVVKQGLEQLDPTWGDVFVHPGIGHSMEWGAANTEELDDATKALVYSEVLHRIVRRRELTESLEDSRRRLIDDPYPEESGLTFRMSSYMLLGGVDTSDPVSESYYLTKETKERRVTWMVYANPDLTAARLAHDESNRKVGKTPLAPADYVRGVSWREDAHIITSGRRLRRDIRNHGASALGHRFDSVDGNYELYTDSDAMKPDGAAPLSAEDVVRETKKHHDRLPDGRDIEVMDRLMKRLFT